jgi:hypothetical protein
MIRPAASWTVKPLREITVKRERELRRLMSILDDPEMSIDAWIDIFKRHLDQILVMAVLSNGDMAGFIYVRPPATTYPNRGMMPLTVMLPQVPRELSKRAFDLCLQWLEMHGAKYVVGWTKRSPRVLRRIYGYDVMKERQIIVPIGDHDEHLNVERMAPYV